MALSVKTITSDAQCVSEDERGVMTLANKVEIRASIEKDGRMLSAVFTFFPGYKWDGLSVPKIFQWFIPSWDKSNPKFNAAGMLHDAAYATGGFYGWLTREECDDLLRSTLREAGYGRFKAGVADLCVGWFAGGKKHWKADKYDSARFVTLE